MDQDKKPAASATQAPLPAAPVSAMKPRSRLSRETTLGMMVAGVFIALVAGVVLTKTIFKSLGTERESQAMVQAPPVEAAPSKQAPGVPKAPTVIAPSQPAFTIKPPPSDIQPAHAETMIVPDQAAPLIAPPAEPVKMDIPIITDGPVRTPAATPGKTDAPLIVLPPSDDPVAPVRPPGRDDITATQATDPSTPKAKNPIIQVGGGDAKKDARPNIEQPPPMFDAPPIFEPLPMIKVETPKVDAKLDPYAGKVETPKVDAKLDPYAGKVETPKVDAKLDPYASKVETPKVDAKLDRPMKIDLPPLKIEPAPKIETLPEPPVRKESPAKIDPSAFDPPMKKDLPPAVIDFAPAKKSEPAPVAAQPKTDVKKDGDYDEDLHSLKQNETYRSISKQYYNSEAYAIALQRYNRDNPGQSDYVRIPPIWLLEKKYAGDISANQARPVNYAPATAAVAAPRSESVYTVADNGEMLADVARKQLGSEDGWKRIWDLNPQLNPAKTIPGGTRLRLPGQ